MTSGLTTVLRRSRPATAAARSGHTSAGSVSSPSRWIKSSANCGARPCSWPQEHPAWCIPRRRSFSTHVRTGDRCARSTSARRSLPIGYFSAKPCSDPREKYCRNCFESPLAAEYGLRAELFQISPVLSNTDLDQQRHLQWIDLLHLLAHQLSHVLYF